MRYHHRIIHSTHLFFVHIKYVLLISLEGMLYHLTGNPSTFTQEAYDEDCGKKKFKIIQNNPRSKAVELIANNLITCSFKLQKLGKA